MNNNEDTEFVIKAFFYFNNFLALCSCDCVVFIFPFRLGFTL